MPFVLMLLSFGIIIFIVARKFSVLANVDVKNIPEEKERRFKEEIISNRLKRNIVKWNSKLSRNIAPVWRTVVNFFKWLLGKLYEIKENYKASETNQAVVSEENVNILLKEAEKLADQDNFNKTEKKLIEAINLDPKNIEAFNLLGELYFKNKNYNEAIQTLEHVLKLMKNDDSEVYFNLSLIHKEAGDFNKALVGIENSLKIEPNNPRYLDTFLEISIIKKDKTLAFEAYKRLKKANPENQKLAELKRQIDEL